MLENTKELNRLQRLKLIKLMIRSVPEFNGFDSADLACRRLLEEVKENNFSVEELNEVLVLMNENNQIYSDSRRDSELQIRALEKMGVNLDGYTNLKKLLER